VSGTPDPSGAVSVITNSKQKSGRSVRFGIGHRIYGKTANLEGMTEQEQAETCVAYARVSSAHQAEKGVSMEAQVRRLKAYAEYRNFLLPDENIFIDKGVSAGTPLWNRPAGKQMRKQILCSEVSHLLAYKMDRLFRNTRDCLTCVDELREEDVHMHFCEFDGGPMDTTSAAGRMFLTVLAAFGELERGLISERTKLAIEHLKQNMRRFTNDIYGWDHDEDNNLTPNWEEQKWVDWMRVQHFDNGLSGSEIARLLNEQGVPTKRGKKWSYMTVLRTIRYEFHRFR